MHASTDSCSLSPSHHIPQIIIMYFISPAFCVRFYAFTFEKSKKKFTAHELGGEWKNAFGENLRRRNFA